MREYIEGGGGVDRVSEEDSRRGLESCAPATPPITPPSPDPSGSRLVEKESWERKVSPLEQNANPLIAFLREINSWRIKRIEGKLQGLALPWIYGDDWSDVLTMPVIPGLDFPCNIAANYEDILLHIYIGHLACNSLLVFRN